jgi:ADP-ribose pyrophosphatase YjhB (NUDIX family)
VSAAPGGYLAGEDPDDALLRELRDELAGHGIVIDDPAEGEPVAFRDVPGA